MIELVEGFWCDPFEVKIVKAIDEHSCVLYITGEGAMDGHVLPYSAEDVVQQVMDEREKYDEEPEEEDENQEPDEDDEDE